MPAVLRRMPKPEGFIHLVELGCGEKAERVVGLARRASSLHRQKTFLGIDISPVRAEATLREQGFFERPTNLRFERADALNALNKLKPNSVGSVLAEYFLDGAAPQYRSSVLAEIKKVLIPNGRFIWVCNNVVADFLRKAVQEAGLKVVRSAPLSDREMKAVHTNSLSR